MGVLGLQGEPSRDCAVTDRKWLSTGKAESPIRAISGHQYQLPIWPSLQSWVGTAPLARTQGLPGDLSSWRLTKLEKVQTRKDQSGKVY